MSLMRRRTILQSQQVQEIGYKDGTYGVCSVENDVWRAGPASAEETGLSAVVPFKSPFRIEVGDTIKFVYDGYSISGVSVIFSIAENTIINARPTNGYTREITATTAGEAQALFFRFAGNTSNTFVFTPHIYLNGIQKA